MSTYETFIDKFLTYSKTELAVAESYPEVRLDYADGLADGFKKALEYFKQLKDTCDLVDLIKHGKYYSFACKIEFPEDVNKKIFEYLK